MKITNSALGIIRIDIDDTEYLFPGNGSITVADVHVARLLREHAELVPNTTPVAEEV